jgi:hypothetical protein
MRGVGANGRSGEGLLEMWTQQFGILARMPHATAARQVLDTAASMGRHLPMSRKTVRNSISLSPV